MSFVTERDWTTAAGLRAVCLMVNDGSHRCGYVAVPQGHRLHGVAYNESSRWLGAPKNEPLGKRGIIPAFCAALGGDESAWTEPQMVFDVHGGITFSGAGEKGYPAEGEGLWWFGFDCAHSGDISGRPEYRAQYSVDPESVFRSQAYVEAECESLARQLIERVMTFAESI